MASYFASPPCCVLSQEDGSPCHPVSLPSSSSMSAPSSPFCCSRKCSLARSRHIVQCLRVSIPRAISRLDTPGGVPPPSQVPCRCSCWLQLVLPVQLLVTLMLVTPGSTGCCWCCCWCFWCYCAQPVRNGLREIRCVGESWWPLLQRARFQRGVADGENGHRAGEAETVQGWPSVWVVL